MRAFIYSLDAYIAVVITIFALMLMLGYSALSNEGYFTYYQAKILTLDGLRMLIESNALVSTDSHPGLMLDKIIPEQYSYLLQKGSTAIASRGSVGDYRKARVSTSVAVSSGQIENLVGNIYGYSTCTGRETICSHPDLITDALDRIGVHTYILTVAI